MSRNHGRRQRGILAIRLEVCPVLVARGIGFADGHWQRVTSLGGVFVALQQHRVRNVIRVQRIKFLAIFFSKGDHEANALKIDLHALVGVVAKSYIKGHNATIEGRFLGKLFLVAGRMGPSFYGDSDSFVSVYRAAASRNGGAGLLDRKRPCGTEAKSSAENGSQVISHLDIID